MTNCSIEIVHHVKKLAYGQEYYTAQDSRGSTAFVNAVRSARVLNPMTQSEAESLGLDDTERRRCFRIDRDKANMAPASEADWYRFESVELLNGDNVGVPVAWEKPEHDPERMQAAEKLFMQLLDKLASQGRTVNPTGGPNYAPPVFAREPEAKAAKINKRAFKEAMGRLFDSKFIRAEEVGTTAKPKTIIVRARQ